MTQEHLVRSALPLLVVAQRLPLVQPQHLQVEKPRGLLPMVMAKPLAVGSLLLLLAQPLVGPPVLQSRVQPYLHPLVQAPKLMMRALARLLLVERLLLVVVVVAGPHPNQKQVLVVAMNLVQ